MPDIKTLRFVAPLVGLLLAATGPEMAQAADSGFRLEVGPEASVTRALDGTMGYQSGLHVGADLWGLGPLGLSMKATRGLSNTNLALTTSGVSQTTTAYTEIQFGPSLNFHLMPLRLSLAAGPYLGMSSLDPHSVVDMDYYVTPPLWNEAQFMGLFAEGRIDINTPILSPFLVVQSRVQDISQAQSSVNQALVGNYQGADLTATGGVRLNFLPWLKVGLAGFAGRSFNSLDPSQARQETVRYGGTAWLVVFLH